MLWIYTWHWLWLATDHYQFNIHQNSIVRHSVWLQYSYLVCFCGGFSGVLFFVFSISLSLVKNWGNLTWVRHSSCKSSTTHSHKGVVFLCVQIMVWLPVFGIFSACMHGDACNCTQGSADTVAESALEVGPGEKFFAAPGTRTHISICLLYTSDAADES